MPSAALAIPGNVELKSVFAKPVKVDRYGPGLTYPIGHPNEGDPVPEGDINEYARCTPEADNRTEYGTDGAWDPLADLSQYGLTNGGLNENPDPPYNTLPGRMPSTNDLNVAEQAGASHDLCFGFTLTPNMQAGIAGTQRGNNPALPDIDETHVSPSSGPTVDNDDLRDAVIEMPAGFAAALATGPAATCSNADFALDVYTAVPLGCNSAQVGTVYVRATHGVSGSGGMGMITMGGAPNAVSPALEYGLGRLYNLPPAAGELARLGVSIKPLSGAAPSKFIVRMALAPDGSGRIRAVTENAPRRLYINSEVCPAAPTPPTPPQAGCEGKQLGELKSTATGKSLYIESVAIRAWGKKDDHAQLAGDFSEWDTSCTPKTASATVTTYNGTTSSMTSEPYTLEGCDQLDFDPSLSIETDQADPGVPTGMTVSLGLGQDTKEVGGETVKTALLKDAVVKLPPGLEIGAQAGSKAGGLKLCSAAEFAKNSAAPATCAAETKAGTVTIESPLLGASRLLTGDVFLGAQNGVGTLPDLYIQATADGSSAADAARIKLVGQVSVDEVTGQVTTTFTNNPQLRFSELKLVFPDGPTALFTTPRTCGPASADSVFTPWSGTAPVTRTVTIEIGGDCAAVPFAPTYAIAPDNADAGASSPTEVTIERADKSPWLKEIVVALPAGFLANLKLIADCSDADAAAGTCGEAARIGSVTTSSGAGPQPYSLSGSMYLTQYKPGHVAYTSIAVRAKVGDLDLGTVVVPGEIDLDPNNASLMLKTSVPTRFKGIALSLRKVDVNIDRPGFALNPSACGPHASALGAIGEAGESFLATTQVAYTGCANKAFAPAINAQVIGEPAVGGHPAVKIDLGTRAGDSNLRSVAVTLPAGLSPDIKNLQQRCTQAQFDTATCPATLKVGSVVVAVSITDELIPGDVFLVDQPGQTLPGIGLSFTGRYTQRLTSTVRYAGDRLLATFPTIPDLPVTGMSMSLDGGPRGILVRTTKCPNAKTAWDAAFGGQGGQAHNAAQIVDCQAGAAKVELKNPKTPKPSWSKKKGLSLSMTDLGGRNLRSAKLTLPKGLTFDAKKAKKKNAVSGKIIGSKVKVKTKRSKSSLTLSTTQNTATKLSIKIKPSALKRSTKKIKKGKKVSFKLRLAFTDGTTKSYTLKVKAP